jgi:multidrug efflux pump subunit AcrA (membrane-fusion protein)
VPTAADILADRAAIALAEADLELAQSQLQFVDLTTPVSGTVAAVSITAGDTVSASSTSAVITVIGATGYVVTATVPLSQVKIVEVGQTADLEVPVTDQVLTGTVSSIGVLNASTTSSTPSYTVNVAVDPTDVQLYDGSSAQVHVTVAGGDQVLTVPSSAVHLDGSAVTVQVLRDGVAEDVEVTRGAVGSELTEITEGLSEGDQVVLADLTQAIVSDDSSTSTGLSGLSGSTEQEQTFQRPDFSGGQMPDFGSMGAPPGS